MNMIKSLNLVDMLPKSIDINGTSYAFTVYINYEESLCLAYINLNDLHDLLFVIVIEPGIAHSDDDLEHIDDICEIYTVSNAMTAFNLMYNSLVWNGIIEAGDENDPYDYTQVEGYEDLDLDYEEEMAIKPNVDVDKDDYIKIVNKDFVESEVVDTDIVEPADVVANTKYIEVKIPINERSAMNKSLQRMFDLCADSTDDYIKLTIDVEDGKILEYKCDFDYKLTYKLVDSGIYTAYDKDWKKLFEYEGYVPKICAISDPEYGYGDYVVLKIDNDGKLSDWPEETDVKVLLNDLVYDAFTLCEQ